ncbi:DUF2703 domain-containing protein [Sporomusa aerivorans]|uniref:DUF2703 domain-containing protein n=1 Tax=Sporomusa aerivorans TaxID=204936 RepID=UPI00352AADF8
MSDYQKTIGRSFFLPGMAIPAKMNGMKYEFSINPYCSEIKAEETVVCIGAGTGIAALQYSYFTRRKASVIVVDNVLERITEMNANLKLAAEENQWFQFDYIKIVHGDILELPLPSECIDIAVFNCMDNKVEANDLKQALTEINRVIKLGGRLYLAGTITNSPIPGNLNDEFLRKENLTGGMLREDYIDLFANAGFGEIQVRARRPYHVFGKVRYGIEEDVIFDTVEIAAFKIPLPEDGLCCYIGETATYTGNDKFYDDGKGHILKQDIPFSVCHRTAERLRSLGHADVVLSPPTYHYADWKNGGNSCNCYTNSSVPDKIASSCCGTLQSTAEAACCCGFETANSALCCSAEKTSVTKKPLKIDYLYLDLDDCKRCVDTDDVLGNTLAEIESLLESAGYEVKLTKIHVANRAIAQRYKFMTSPTIRVNGRDLDIEFKESLCGECGDLCCDSTVDCRVWIYEGNEYEVPPKEMLVNKILEAVYTKPEPVGEQPYVMPSNLKKFFTGLEKQI